MAHDRGGTQRRVFPGLAAASAVILISGVVAACSKSDANYFTHCVDSQTGQVVDDSKCDNDTTGRYYYYMDTVHRPYGYVVPQSQRTGKAWVRANDPAARSAAGLPKTGSIKNGFTVRSRSGGFDGSHSSGSHGSDSGGHGSGGS